MRFRAGRGKPPFYLTSRRSTRQPACAPGRSSRARGVGERLSPPCSGGRSRC